MQLQIIELKPDRNLIRNNFDGYKLSLDPIAVIKQELTTPVHKAKPTEDQYSFLHTELFSMHNHLVQDPWNRKTSYFITSEDLILKCSYDETSGRPAPPEIVYEPNFMATRRDGDYNVSFQFISEKYSLLCDGINRIVVADTGDRYKQSLWKEVFSCQLTDEFRGILLKDARLDVLDGNTIISFILQRVVNDEHAYKTQLIWCNAKYDAEANEWHFKRLESLSARGALRYCAFEPGAASIVVCGNKEYTFDSAASGKKDESAKPVDSMANIAPYTWTQSDEDITVKFNKIYSQIKNDYKIVCTKNSINVKCLEDTLLDGQFFGKIDADLTTWTLENGYLQVTLVKEIPSFSWNFLTENGPEESNETQNTSTPIDNRPIPNLEAQIEDCDLPSYAMEEEYSIVRINLELRRPTHKILLGNNSPLFYTTLRPGFPPAIVTREDVDASLWLQQYIPTKPNQWSLRHEGNLHALGYVQASKQQKKFINCSPDLSYSIISEAHRHVFIYKANYNTANGLRNRSGPQITLGKQHLITLEEQDEVLGMSTDDNIAILLLGKCILYLQINVN